MIKNICYVTDDNYAHLTGVSIMSMIKNNPNLKGELCFHIVCDGVSEENRKRLNSLQELLKTKIILYAVELQRYMERKDNNREWPVTTYGRIFLSEILDCSIEKILYIDCDTVVVGNIEPLLKIELKGNKIIAGAGNGPYMNKAIGLPKKYTYVNAGILCINLKEWRLQKITKRLLLTYYGLDDEPKFCDQDLINLECKDLIAPIIPYEYNAQGLISFLPHNYISKNIAIIHYWGSEYRTRRKDLMNLIMEYYSVSPWKELPITDDRPFSKKLKDQARITLRPVLRYLFPVSMRRWLRQLLDM